MGKKIGIDIDGVITAEGGDKDNIWHKTLCQYFGKELERKRDVFDFKKAYDLSEESIKNFLSENIKNVYKKVKPAPDIQKIFKKLQELDFKIILITARKSKFNKLTKNWLEKYNIPYDKLIHEEDKAPLAKKMGIEIFVEDNKENIIELSLFNIPVIIMDRYHNRGINTAPNIFRAHNWQEVKNHVLNYFNL